MANENVEICLKKKQSRPAWAEKNNDHHRWIIAIFFATKANFIYYYR